VDTPDHDNGWEYDGKQAHDEVLTPTVKNFLSKFVTVRHTPLTLKSERKSESKSKIENYNKSTRQDEQRGE